MSPKVSKKRSVSADTVPAAPSNTIPVFDIGYWIICESVERLPLALRLFDNLAKYGAVWIEHSSLEQIDVNIGFDLQTSLWTKAKNLRTCNNSTAGGASNPNFRGYDGGSQGTSSFREERELFSVGHPNDEQHPNVYPSQQDWPGTGAFCQWTEWFVRWNDLSVFSPLFDALSLAALTRLSGAGGWGLSTFKDWHDQHNHQLHCLRYTTTKDGGARLDEHTDESTLRLLYLQDQGGLEIESVETRANALHPQWESSDNSEAHARHRENDVYVKVPYREGSILCLAGDFIEMLTHGALKATRHRVVCPPSAAETKKLSKKKTAIHRSTMAIFAAPNSDLEIPHVLGWPVRSDYTGGYQYGGGTVEGHMIARLSGHDTTAGHQWSGIVTENAGDDAAQWQHPATKKDKQKSKDEKGAQAVDEEHKERPRKKRTAERAKGDASRTKPKSPAQKKNGLARPKVEPTSPIKVQPAKARLVRRGERARPLTEKARQNRVQKRR